MIPLEAFCGSRALVLGYGRSGAATAEALASGGAGVSVWDDSPEARRIAASDGHAIACAKTAGRGEVDLVAVSPGVPSFGPRVHPIVSAARRYGAAVDNDIGLFFEWLSARECGRRPTVIGVTGTNGKSTTTALIAHILEENGIKACAAGNIGLPVLALEPALPWEALVLELSSFQLEAAGSLSPDVAVFLNLEEDHLDRHGSLAAYLAAKERLFAPDYAERRFVVGVEDEAGLRLANRLAALARVAGGYPEKVLEVFGEESRSSGFASGCSISNGTYSHFADGRQLREYTATETPALRGAHNLRNEVAAFLVTARLLGDSSGIRRALRSFPGLPHRLERLGVLAGAEYINDSKATNASSTARALAATNRIRWIAGGKPKPGGYGSLGPLFGRIRHAYLIGESAGAISAALGDRVPHAECGDLASAFARAADDAEPGDTVLLSPACASFDQFRDFEARGEVFRRLFQIRAGLEVEGGGLPECD